VRVLVLSTYELGHQPLGLAAAAGIIGGAGHEVRSVDLAIDPLPEGGLDWADAVVISVPMHTATRLAIAVVEGTRAQHPDLPVALVGLYAHVAAGSPLFGPNDLLASGEFGRALVDWLASTQSASVPVGTPGSARGPRAARPEDRDRLESGPLATTSAGTARQAQIPISRRLLPGLDRYARLVTASGDKLAGYVEATRGCSHLCRHCPVPVIYRGRTRVVAADEVLGDIGGLVDSGARHITFGDADFLNRPGHALALIHDLHNAWPDVTFDVTVKIEHVLRHERIWGDVAEAGCVFVISAVESVDDRVLRLLDKGHDTAGTVRALSILSAAGIEARPSLLPFTPWTTLDGFAELIEFVLAHDLVDSIDPVQFGIRLLLPPGSLLLEAPNPELAASLTGYDEGTLSWTWRSLDPQVDELQAEVAGLAERAAAVAEPTRITYQEIRRSTFSRLGRPDPRAGAVAKLAVEPAAVRPHLSESWFCCAEPTKRQLAQVVSR
jgi:radical SAM superfamily enzyme YgiQ (UPF0313 family)